jgi:hypothetical protein
MWDFNRRAYLRTLSCPVSHARQGDSRCKDYIPHFRVAGPASVCCYCVQQLVSLRLLQEFFVFAARAIRLWKNGCWVWS